MDKFFPIIAMLLIFVVFIILPKNKEAKKAKSFFSSLKAGDKIVTVSGIHGKIAEIADTTVVIETMSGKLKIEKNAISVDLSNKINAPKK
jgi:preprotein translocase subunit YajC